ncbi:MAG: hypothetical protein A2W91_02990 [Bacteroidetes bacterium GWF2_38_335]|nr:MAG: hypothetical protein A2W91_02990 [Bacteroidetes bacterium GWF2_38_335]OFY77544.1 MAG: hypothetical protein A2281_01770 [Bacteroidetes bacterium RIFOXYA12_FULL_38_20]HBS87159.1 hypothetical protein [Bacteroidales bacterium]
MNDIIHYLQSLDIFSWQIITLLIVSGFVVGFINTMAGSGSAIVFYIFTLLGLSSQYANGTVRLGVLLQTLVASLNFRKQKLLAVKKGLWLGIPTVIGSLIGAQFAATLEEENFELVIGSFMLLMLVFVLIKPERWIKGKAGLIKDKPTYLQILIFFVIGLYGGFIHIGVGIFLLAGLVLNAGYDIVTANALKVFIVLLYAPFALAVFIYHGQIDYGIGLISAIGNLGGGYVASKYAGKWGGNFIRWFLIVVLIIFASNLLGITNLIFNG